MSNRLATAASLYLRQHGEDPVRWWPWCEEALQLARDEQRPILLSIGYAACHWCHVMARESFANPDLAEQINRQFVAIKVDREERPDLDRAFQLAHQALNRRAGGWPLTAFLDPNRRLPFFVGTYFPPQPRQGMPAFAELLDQVAAWYQQNSSDWDKQGQGLADFLAQHGLNPPHAGELDGGPIEAAAQRILQHADWQNGGRQGAPKFPPHAQLRWALAQLPRQPLIGAETEESDAEADARQGSLLRLLRVRPAEAGAPEHALFSLARMVDSGLRDHIGGGFYRYCVDSQWDIPHFEKMLVDNAQLLGLLAEAQHIVPHADWREAAVGCVRWLQEEMALPEGGYASALDADDADGVEGASYLWTREQWRDCLGEQADWMGQIYGLDGEANAGQQHWHVRRRMDDDALTALAQQRGLSLAQLLKNMAEQRRRLFLFRAQRPPPQRDEKCLAAANGLLLQGLACAARAFVRGDWRQLAVELRDQLMRRLRDSPRLRALDYADQRGGPGFLDDHAAMLEGVLELLQVQFDTLGLEWAVELAENLLSEFEHSEQGGFWFTAHAQIDTPHRGKPVFDEATPSGNALAARGLQLLGCLLAEPRYLEAAERCLRAAWSSLQQAPEGCCALLEVLQQQLDPSPVLIARFSNVNENERWRQSLALAEQQRYPVFRLPAANVLLPRALESKRWLSGGRVYWCQGSRCLPRFDSPVALSAAISRAARPAAG